ncbi:MAG TPA: hypothetical protein DGZ34_05680 [Lachnospiraceae bacterium]|nr:hypothetical protein [Lachnospiraceae bacterium]
MSLSTFVSTAEAQEGNGGSTYQNWYGSNGAWCAMFISWCADQADILTQESSASYPLVYKTASVTTMRTWYSDNRRAFAISASPTSGNYPQVGDLVTIRPTSTGVDHGHIGIVVATNGNKITTIEGNTAGKVKRVEYTDLFRAGYGTLQWVLSNHTSW